MKRWWQNVIKDYLTFSARERNGIFVFTALLSSAILIGYFFPVHKTAVPKDAFQKELARLKISIDSSRHNNFDYDDNNRDYYRPKHYGNEGVEGELFAFDPNTLDAEGWKRLGLREKTITTIHNFLAKGYKFRQPEDIRKIYGLRQSEADRLLPYVHISETVASNTSANNADNRVYTANSAKEIYTPKVIDVNTADTSALISLPGIGSKLANRIVNFRQKLGGFSSVNQLAETYGIPDSTFQRIKPRLQCNKPSLRTININTADANTFKNHPYIKWNIANAIVNYRTQHGNYKTIEDLRKIEIISDDLFNKIAPYLAL